MEEFLSYEECVQLRDAGFPQPAYAPFQFWYSKSGVDRMIWNIDQFGIGWIHNGEIHINSPEQFGGVYAPTALDIFKELGEGYHLYQTQRFENRSPIDPLWAVDSPKDANGKFQTFYGQNVFTALRMAFFHKTKGDPLHGFEPIENLLNS